MDHRRPALAHQCPRRPEIHFCPLYRPDQRRRDARLEPGGGLLPADDQGPVRHALPRGRRERSGHVPIAAPAQYRPAKRGQASRRGAALYPRHDGVWATTADDIADYYLANYYDQVKSWIADRKAQTET